MKKTIYIRLTNVITKEEKMFFSHCLELDVASQGETVEETEKKLKDAILLYLNTIKELGTREEIFKKKNIKYIHINLCWKKIKCRRALIISPSSLNKLYL